jgi:hypothetical protein
MADRDVLLRLVRAVDAYFAAKGAGDQADWMRTFNALLAALAEARRVLAQ